MKGSIHPTCLVFAAMILLFGSTLATLAHPEEEDKDNDLAEYLFVVGGYTDFGLGNTTEIVSLTEGSAIPDCLNTLSSHPKVVAPAAGGALPDAGYLPHVCGSVYPPYNECWRYSPLDDSWTKTSTIPSPTPELFVAPAYHPGWGIIMSGGYYDGDDLSSTTITKDGEEFESLAPMPYTASVHCVAAIDNNTMFTTGLGRRYDESFLYNRSTGEWVSVPKMPTGRIDMLCGVVMDGSGQAQVVVVGGLGLDVVEIFNVQEETWRTANNPFPTEPEGSAVVQHEDTFYVVGGYEMDTIYRFEVSDESWTLMPNRMKYRREGATAMMVKSSIFPTCD